MTKPLLNPPHWGGLINVLYSPSLMGRAGLGFLLFIFSCGNGDVKSKKKIDPSQFKEQLLKVNKYEVEKQSDEIDQYIVRHNWKMKKTGTGLRYMFLANGNGIQPQSRDFV